MVYRPKPPRILRFRSYIILSVFKINRLGLIRRMNSVKIMVATDKTKKILDKFHKSWLKLSKDKLTGLLRGNRRIDILLIRRKMFFRAISFRFKNTLVDKKVLTSSSERLIKVGRYKLCRVSWAKRLINKRGRRLQVSYLGLKRIRLVQRSFWFYGLRGYTVVFYDKAAHSSFIEELQDYKYGRDHNGAKSKLRLRKRRKIFLYKPKANTMIIRKLRLGIWPSLHISNIPNACISSVSELTLNSLAFFLRYKPLASRGTIVSRLKLKRVVRAMSKGPVAKKKKSSVQVSLGRRSFKTFHTVNFSLDYVGVSLTPGPIRSQKVSDPIIVVF